MKTHQHFYRQSVFKPLCSFFEARRCFDDNPNDESSGVGKFFTEVGDWFKIKTEEKSAMTKDVREELKKLKGKIRKEEDPNGGTLERVKEFVGYNESKAKLHESLVKTLGNFSEREAIAFQNAGIQAFPNASGLATELHAIGLTGKQLTKLISEKARGIFTFAEITADDIIDLMLQEDVGRLTEVQASLRFRDNEGLETKIKTSILPKITDLSLTTKTTDQLQNVAKAIQNRDILEGENNLEMVKVADFKRGWFGNGELTRDVDGGDMHVFEAEGITELGLFKELEDAFRFAGKNGTLNWEKVNNTLIQSGKDFIKLQNALKEGEDATEGIYGEALKDVGLRGKTGIYDKVFEDMAKGLKVRTTEKDAVLGMKTETKALDWKKTKNKILDGDGVEGDEDIFLARLGVYHEKQLAGYRALSTSPHFQEKMQFDGFDTFVAKYRDANKKQLTTEAKNIGLEDTEKINTFKSKNGYTPHDFVLYAGILEAMEDLYTKASAKNKEVQFNDIYPQLRHIFTAGAIYNEASGKWILGAGYTHNIPLTKDLSIQVGGGMSSLGPYANLGATYSIIEASNPNGFSLSANAGAGLSVTDGLGVMPRVGFNASWGRLNAGIGTNVLSPLGIDAYLGISIKDYEDYMEDFVPNKLNQRLSPFATAEFNNNQIKITINDDTNLNDVQFKGLNVEERNNFLRNHIQNAYRAELEDTKGDVTKWGITVSLANLMTNSAGSPFLMALGLLNISFSTGAKFTAFSEEQLGQIGANILKSQDENMNSDVLKEGAFNIRRLQAKGRDAKGNLQFENLQSVNDTIESVQKVLGWTAKKDAQGNLFLKPDTEENTDTHIIFTEEAKANTTVNTTTGVFKLGTLSGTHQYCFTRTFDATKGVETVVIGIDKHISAYKAETLSKRGFLGLNGGKVTMYDGVSENSTLEMTNQSAREAVSAPVTVQNFDDQWETFEAKVPKGSQLDKDIDLWARGTRTPETRDTIYKAVKDSMGNQNLDAITINALIARRQMGDISDIRNDPNKDTKIQRRIASGVKEFTKRKINVTEKSFKNDDKPVDIPRGAKFLTLVRAIYGTNKPYQTLEMVEVAEQERHQLVGYTEILGPNIRNELANKNAEGDQKFELWENLKEYLMAFGVTEIEKQKEMYKMMIKDGEIVIDGGNGKHYQVRMHVFSGLYYPKDQNNPACYNPSLGWYFEVTEVTPNTVINATSDTPKGKIGPRDVTLGAGVGGIFGKPLEIVIKPKEPEVKKPEVKEPEVEPPKPVEPPPEKKDPVVPKPKDPPVIVKLEPPQKVEQVQNRDGGGSVGYDIPGSPTTPQGTLPTSPSGDVPIASAPPLSPTTPTPALPDTSISVGGGGRPVTRGPNY